MVALDVFSVAHKGIPIVSAMLHYIPNVALKTILGLGIGIGVFATWGLAARFAVKMLKKKIFKKG